MVIALIVIGYILIGLFAGTFYHIYNNHTDIEFETGLIAMFWVFIIPVFILYLIGKFIVNLFKFPAAWLAEKVDAIDNYIECKQFERFLVKNNCYSQALNIIINNLHQTFSEFVKNTPDNRFIDAIALYDHGGEFDWRTIKVKWNNR